MTETEMLVGDKWQYARRRKQGQMIAQRQDILRAAKLLKGKAHKDARAVLARKIHALGEEIRSLERLGDVLEDFLSQGG